MPRSIFNPADVDLSIRKLSTGKGPAFTHFFQYLSNPDTNQLVLPTTKPWFLKNLRSDLSSWRTALSLVPPSRLLTIPWLALIADSRPDLYDKDDSLKTRIIMENIRLYTTKLTPDGLYIGSYLSLGTAFEPPLTFVTPNQLKPRTSSTQDNAAHDHHKPDLDPHFLPPSPKKPAPSSVLSGYLGTKDATKDGTKTKEPAFITSNDLDDNVDEYALRLKELDALLAEQVLLASTPSKDKTKPQKDRSKFVDSEIVRLQTMIAKYESTKDL